MRKFKAIQLDVSIRLARPCEVSSICALFFEWLKFGEKKERIDQIRRSIRAREILVSIEPKSKKIIGFIQGVIQNDPISSGPILCVASLYVTKKFRRTGIGSELLRHLIIKALEQGVVGVEVATAQREAYRLYRKFGFSQYRGDMNEILLGLDLKKLQRF